MVTALIFDCDGVLADTERYGHLPAFNQTFAEFGLPVRWDEQEYGRRLAIGGGKERMASLLTPEFVAAAGLPADPAGQAEAVAAWHRRKTAIYTAMVAAGDLPPRPGIARITEQAHAAGWRLAVASTSAEPSVRAVLEHAVGPDRARDFTVLAGDIVPRKKPAPDIYLLALDRLGLSAHDAVVIEDSTTAWPPRSRPGSPAWSPSTTTPPTRISPAPRSSWTPSASPTPPRSPCWPTTARPRPGRT
ncbi:HAD-IA family hydrolase [Catellatospora coxensis]